MDETIKGGRWMNTHDMRGSSYGFYSTCHLDRHQGHHQFHPYRSEMGYFLDEFKKFKSPTFIGEMKKLEDVEAWLLGMKNFLELHDYI